MCVCVSVCVSVCVCGWGDGGKIKLADLVFLKLCTGTFTLKWLSNTCLVGAVFKLDVCVQK